MNKIEKLIQNYERFASLKWETGIAGPQRVWFAVYSKSEERRLRAKVGEFEIATKRHGHGWVLCDLTRSFAEWMAAQEYRESFFTDPDDLEPALSEFRIHTAEKVKSCLTSAEADPNAVVAILGIGALYGFHSVSELIKDVESRIRGRMMVFFPGEYDNSNYRLLDTDRGWNYLAVPITAHNGEMV